MYNENYDKKMSIISHIEILRKHIIRSIIGIFIATLFIMCNKKIMFDYIILAPSKANFITYKIFKNISKSDFLILSDNIQIQNRQIFGQFNTYMWVCIIAGCILSSPYIFYEIWQFVNPALSLSEKRYFQKIIFISLFLFLLGILFGYFVVCPMAINFGYTFNISEIPKNIFDLNDYIYIITQSTISMGITFLIPLFIYFLNKSGLIEVYILKKYRKHVILILTIIAAAITPSDILSTIIVVLPLIILYELSIFFIEKNN